MSTKKAFLVILVLVLCQLLCAESFDIVRADFDWLKPGDREEFLRVRRNAEGGLDRYPNQNSQVLSSCAWGDGLVDVPAGQPVKKGDVVRYYPFCRFFA